ncbi:hypothetical protein D5E69_20585 [Rossellomorea marisflavi]|uniref:hypothetical protein n=1 Tax=Rossellomorea marisflavi TaxID=189381 RepID=UPI0013184960|nr:hypothetical protein [Rossellomorea marisflavi]QHA37939.1 hypothetical protein D5E69_20585 [Rossellomorea marisflavi]
MTTNKPFNLSKLISVLLLAAGAVLLTIVLYFTVQSVRELVYQNGIEKRYSFQSPEDAETVQVFHGVKVQTYRDGPEVLLELQEEERAKVKVPGDQTDEKSDMKAFKGIVQYKLMKEKETGEEWFIAALRLTPEAMKEGDQKFQTFRINENGVVKKSTFSSGANSKLETQWIRGLTEDNIGYHTSLPYQDHPVLTLISTAFAGLVSLFVGLQLRKREKGRKYEAA